MTTQSEETVIGYTREAIRTGFVIGRDGKRHATFRPGEIVSVYGSDAATLKQDGIRSGAGGEDIALPPVHNKSAGEH